MSRPRVLSIAASLLVAAGLVVTWSAPAQAAVLPLTQYVNPFIGTDDSNSPNPVPGGAGAVCALRKLWKTADVFFRTEVRCGAEFGGRGPEHFSGKRGIFLVSFFRDVLPYPGMGGRAFHPP